MNIKNKVVELRNTGMSYKEISATLDMPLGSVKTICARSKAGIPLTSTCKQCNKAITSIKGKKQKEFCDDKCRMTWWNNNRQLVNIKTNYIFTCKYCGNTFTSQTNKNRKYCSHACYLEGRYGNGK